MCSRTRSKGLCICCPNCGRFHGKSIVADSEYTCGKCGTHFGAVVSEGRVTTYEITERDKVPARGSKE